MEPSASKRDHERGPDFADRLYRVLRPILRLPGLWVATDNLDGLRELHSLARDLPAADWPLYRPACRSYPRPLHPLETHCADADMNKVGGPEPPAAVCRPEKGWKSDR